MPVPETDFVSSVSKSFADLSPQLKLAAKYVLDHPNEVASYSLRQVASKSGLSPPTFSRLARAIGFMEYEDLREHCRADIQRRQVSLAERASLIHSDASTERSVNRGGFAAKHALVAVENVQALIDSLDTEQLADVADRLIEADEVVLVGGQSSQIVLSYLRHVVSLATPKWKTVDHTSNSAVSELVGIDSKTVLIFLSVAPYLKRTIAVAEQARAMGGTVISITDDIGSPLLKHATSSFIVPTESRQFFPSHVAILTLLEIIAGMVVRRLGKEANQRIDRVESLSHAIGDYVT